MVGDIISNPYTPYEHEIEDTMFLKFDCLVQFNKTAFKNKKKGFLRSSNKTHSQRFGIQSYFTLELLESLDDEQLGGLLRKSFNQLKENIKKYEENGNY